MTEGFQDIGQMTLVEGGCYKHERADHALGLRGFDTFLLLGHSSCESLYGNVLKLNVLLPDGSVVTRHVSATVKLKRLS